MGHVQNTDQVNRALDSVRAHFPGDGYSVVFRNCNDFSNTFCRALLGKGIPGYINRLAYLGRIWPIRLCIPPALGEADRRSF